MLFASNLVSKNPEEPGSVSQLSVCWSAANESR